MDFLLYFIGRKEPKLKIKNFILGVSLSLTSSLVYAEPSDKVVTSIWASAVAVDYTTTYRLIKAGGGEANPVLSWLDHKPIAMITLGTSLDISVLIIWNKITEDKPKLNKIGILASAGFKFYLANKNYKLYKGIKNHAK